MIALLLLAAAQDGDLGATLKSGQWAAVEKADPKDKARLEELAKSEDKELQWWAAAALAEIDAREALPPLRVTLAAKARTAGSLLGELLGLAGLKLAPSAGATGVAIDVDFRDVPFLEAVDEICRKGRVSLYRQENGFRIAQMGAGGDGPRFCAGVVSAHVRQVTHHTTADFISEPTSSVTVGMGVWLDPRLRVLGRTNEWSIWGVVDEQGRPLSLRKENSASYVHASAGGMFVQANLQAPPAGTKRIARLRSVLTVTLPKKSEELIIEKLSSGGMPSKKVGPVEAKVLRCERAGAAHEVVVEMTSSDKGFQGPEMDEFVLETAAGVRFQREHRGSRSGWKYTMNFRADDAMGAPERLRAPVVTETYSRKVYIELKEIPLP